MQVVEHLLKIRPGVWFNLVRGSVPRVSPFLAPRGRFWQFRFHRSAAVTCGLPLKQKLIISALKQPRVCLTVGFFFGGGGGFGGFSLKEVEAVRGSRSRRAFLRQQSRAEIARVLDAGF